VTPCPEDWGAVCHKRWYIYSSTVKVDAEGFSETSEISYQNIRCHNREIATHVDIKSRRIKLTELVACVGRKNYMCKMLAVKPEKERDYLRDPNADGKIILKLVLK
jgi:hypothetical protein